MTARPKLDQMWRIWYAVLVLLLHIFLLYSAFSRYCSFRVKALRESWEMAPMNFYLAMMVIALFLLPVFLYCAFVRTGNYADDGVQVGRDRENLKVAIGETGQTTAVSCIGRLRRHFMPYTCLLHVLMATALLIPLPVLEAAEIQHEKLSKDSIWHTNLDFLLRPTATARHPLAAEAFNLALALCFLLVRYPSSFWFSNRVFAFMFSVIMCACSVHILLSYEASSVLLKASVSRVSGANLAPAAVLVLFAVGDILLLLANTAFFEFGYAQMLNNLRRYKHYLQLEAASGSSDRSTSSCSDETPCWLSYAPHLLGILLMVVAVVCKAPVLWDWVSLFKTQQQPVMLGAIVSGALYLVLWIGVWFVFGLKANWKFHVRLEMEIPNKLSPGFHDNQGLTHTPEHHRAESSTDSDLGKKPNHYVYVQRDGVSMIPTISEQVDAGSENSYTCSGTVDRQSSGLVKYQVRRNSAQSISQMSGGGSLRRNSQTRKSGNRVTFKDIHETIPGSPGSSQNASSDSGIEASRSTVQISLNDDYARVNKPRAQSRQANYDDYQMFGSLFQEPDRDYYTRQEIEQPTYATQADIYGRMGSSSSVLPPPPPPSTGAEAFGYSDADYVGTRVPDILLSRSPYNSLGRQQHHQQQEQQEEHQHLQQQQQVMHVGGNEFELRTPKHFGPLPATPDDRVDGLCSQV